ncbi:MAG: 3'-5' exoribonuclease YhaM family protein [Thermodesulfobacteriota bacterium]
MYNAEIGQISEFTKPRKDHFKDRQQLTGDSDRTRINSETMRIREITDNQPVAGIFLVKEVNRGETKAGKPYLALTIMDSSGEIGGRVWENADHYLKSCRQGATIRVKAQAQSYRGVLQLRIDSLEEAELSPEEMGNLIPVTAGDISSMAGEITQLARSIEDDHLRNLVLAFFEDRTLFPLFKKAPAAKHMHHACLGGLLEHTLGVTRVADQLADLYPAIDRSLLLAGAMLHDIGKLVEFDYDSLPYDYSDRGRLVGHMVLGIEMIQEKVSLLDNFPEETATRLKHLILAHHGRHEFGSPTLPMMMEAFILHFIDDLDAKINYLSGLGGKLEGEGYQWTDYQRNLERFLYVRANSGGCPPENGADDEAIDRRQQNLWK